MARVLVVDDDEDIRVLVDGVLRIAGLTTTLVPSGVEALEALADGDLPALVILDVQMPVLDGWSTLRRIRADPRTAAVPVVLCTVKSSIDDTAAGWTLGCDGYITKPFAIGDLVEEVNSVLERAPGDRLGRRAAALREIELQHRVG